MANLAGLADLAGLVDMLLALGLLTSFFAAGLYPPLEFPALLLRRDLFLMSAVSTMYYCYFRALPF